MEIRFLGKNLTVTTGMKEHLREKLLKLERYAPRIVEAHVVLEKEKYLYEAEVTLLAKNLRAFGEAQSKENIFTAIDQACSRVEKQLKKYREKVKDHHRKDPKGALSYEGLTRAVTSGIQRKPPPKKRPRIVRTDDFAPKPMSTEEASLQLGLSPQPFLVFLNADSQRVNVLFIRDDGNHGLIEPDF